MMTYDWDDDDLNNWNVLNDNILMHVHIPNVMIMLMMIFKNIDIIWIFREMALEVVLEPGSLR